MFSNTRWREGTPYLWYCAFCFAWGNILFGLDTGSFGSIQALQSFLSQFGELQDDGTYALSSTRKAIMNSIVWPGKLLGTIVFEPIAARIGYKNSIYLCCVCQAIGITIEITAKEWIQFSIGRIIAYFTVGIIENAVPAYHAEISPPALRGFFAGSVMPFTTLGNLWGTGMGRAVADLDDNGWLIAVGVQYIPAVILAVTVPFTIESPRWLALHGRKDQAIRNLTKIRPKHLCADGLAEAEIDAFFAAHEKEGLNPDSEASWVELFRGNHLKRTVIAALLFFFQQTTGGQFVNSYAPTFLSDMGLGDKAFLYSFLAQLSGFIAACGTLVVVDNVGRRPILVAGMFLATMFNFLIAGLGTSGDHSTTTVNAVIASLILLTASTKFSVSTLAYLVGSEIGGKRLRKKTMGFATAIDVVSAFLITFTLPYILSDPGNWQAGVGWLLGGDAFLAMIFSIFCVPELKNRSLEEVDELFEAKLWAWQFNKYKTRSVGIDGAEAGEADSSTVTEERQVAGASKLDE